MDPNQILHDPHFLYIAPLILFISIIGVLVYVIPFWMIFKKAGFSPWLVLLFFVPLANLLVLYIVAFSQWKVVPISQVSPGAYPPAIPPQPSYPATYTGPDRRS